MYRVRWERDVEVGWAGSGKVIFKKSKRLRQPRNLLLSMTCLGFSLLFFSPASPFSISARTLAENEGFEIRRTLSRLGVKTPPLIKLDRDLLVEGYVEGIDAYSWIQRSGAEEAGRLAEEIGRVTGRLHRAGYAFIDNKPQNYIVAEDCLYRVDTGYITRTNRDFPRLLDVATFTASLIPLRAFREAEGGFYRGYTEASGLKVSPSVIPLRDIVAFWMSRPSLKTHPRPPTLGALMFSCLSPASLGGWGARSRV